MEDIGLIWNFDDKKSHDTVPSWTINGVAPSRDSQAWPPVENGLVSKYPIGQSKIDDS